MTFKCPTCSVNILSHLMACKNILEAKHVNQSVTEMPSQQVLVTVWPQFQAPAGHTFADDKLQSLFFFFICNTFVTYFVESCTNIITHFSGHVKTQRNP